jgi:hypothetical protein
MRVGSLQEFPSFGDSDPGGFYRREPKKFWPEIDPYTMTRSELDDQIKRGIERYEKHFPGGGFGWEMFVATAAVIAVGGVAAYAAATPAAAGGAGQAAAQAASASGVGATSNVSGALAAGTGSSPAMAAGSATSAGLGKQAFSVAKNMAPYAGKAGKVAKAAGVKEGDKLAKAANIVEGSSGALDASEKVFQEILRRRGMEMKSEAAKKALRERLERERKSYAAWMRREAAKKKKQNPDVTTTGQDALKTWLPIAAPFIFFALRGQ